jgi:ornithine carbamoyltransferase
MRHLLEIDDLSRDELMAVLHLSDQADPPQVLAGKGAALVFEKPSLRTRSSTEMAVVQLGGHPVMIGSAEVGLGARETPEDVVRTLAGYHAVVAARVFEHEKLERMAAMDVVPVVNLLSDRAHPCQALADLMTIGQHFGRLTDLTVAFVGDGDNNVTRSFALGAAIAGVAIRIASPAGFELPAADVERVRALGGTIELTDRPEDAVAGVDAVYTDVWASMGQEEEAAERRRAFAGFTIDAALLAHASPDAVFLHCLPAHRGEEVAADVLESDRSLVWKQAANRMHTARGALAFLLSEANPR